MSERISLFGLEIDKITCGEAISRARGALRGEGKRALSVFTPNLQILDLARRYPHLRELFSACSLSLPGGAGLLLAVRLATKERFCRVAGIDFGESLIALAEQEGARVFLLGGKEGVADLAEKKLKAKHPRLCVCGTHHGYIARCEEDALVEQINACSPEVLIVCMGAPRQEDFVRRKLASLPSVKVSACLGGSLDVWSGSVARAPRAFQKLSLEWLWRICLEPNRAGRFFRSLPTLFFAFLEGSKKCPTKSRSRS